MLFRAKKVAQGMATKFIGRNKQDGGQFSYRSVASIAELRRLL